MITSEIESDFLRYLLEQKYEPGDRLPSINQLSEETGIGVGKLREQLEVVRTLGLIDARPRRGIVRTEYDFLPPVRLSLLAALAIDPNHFEAFSGLRIHLEMAYWDEAVVLLTDEDKRHLKSLVEQAICKLSRPRIQIPFQEHRDLHLTIYRRLNNPFVIGLLEAYWDAYEAVELSTYADYQYLTDVWAYHQRIVDALCAGEIQLGKQLLVEHMQLLDSRGINLDGLRDNGAIQAFADNQRPVAAHAANEH